jgi:hypothetical protein
LSGFAAGRVARLVEVGGAGRDIFPLEQRAVTDEHRDRKP